MAMLVITRGYLETPPVNSDHRRMAPATSRQTHKRRVSRCAASPDGRIGHDDTKNGGQVGQGKMTWDFFGG